MNDDRVNPPEVKYDPHYIYYSSFATEQLQEEKLWVNRMIQRSDDAQSFKLLCYHRLQAIVALLSERGAKI